MILTLHLVIGAVIAVKLKFLPILILFALLSHYLLDSLPHLEYSIQNIKNKKWKKSGLDFLKLILDLGIGSILIVFIYYITKTNYFVLFIAAFFGILSDILIVLSWLFPNSKILKYHFNFHQKAHFPKKQKISVWTKIFIQLLVILIGFAVLRYI